VDEQDGARDIDAAPQLAIIDIPDERGTFPFGRYCSLVPGLGASSPIPANISVTRCKVDLAVAQAYFRDDIQPHRRSRAHEAKPHEEIKVGKKLKKAIEGKLKACLMAGFFRSIYVAFD